jgi:hypothetical protein
MATLRLKSNRTSDGQLGRLLPPAKNFGPWIWGKFTQSGTLNLR